MGEAMTFRNATTCTECGGDNSRVTDTRQADAKGNDTGTIKRMRYCADCGTTWKTVEIDLSAADMLHDSHEERERCKQIILDEIERWKVAEGEENHDEHALAYGVGVGALSNVLCRVMGLKIADDNQA